MSRLFLIHLSAPTLIALCCAVALPAQGQPYPNRPVHVVNPFAAGGSSDVSARALGQKLQEAMGQPFVVESKPGANGNLGTEFVARAAPDGYTLLMAVD